MIFKKYFSDIQLLLEEVADKEQDNIVKAAELIGKSISENGVLHVFGCGHSQMYAMELFYRAGGLVPVNAILTPALSLAPTAPLSTFAERQPGLAKAILDGETINPKDSMLIVSTSGRNAVPIEMAIEARERGLNVIALTSLDFSAAVDSRHVSGKKLHEIADVVLDNHGEAGDAILELPGMDAKFGPTSSIIGFTILQAIIAQVIENLNNADVEVPIYVSSNLDKGDEINKKHIEKYRSRIKCL